MAEDDRPILERLESGPPDDPEQVARDYEEAADLIRRLHKEFLQIGRNLSRRRGAVED